MLPASYIPHMQNCFEIKKSKELIEFLKTKEKKDAFYDFDYQMQTNYGFVYNLKGGQVIFIPNDFRNNGLIFKTKKCFNKYVDDDKFPIQNPEQSLYDTEIDRIKTINKQIDFYRNHLNTILKFDYAEISREAAQAYLKKVIGRTIKKLTTHTDLIGLIAIFGEVIRKEIGGKWVIEKWYGTYNPHFKPRILTKDKKLIFIDDTILGKVKWKVSFADFIFKDTEGIIDMKTRSKHQHCRILKD